jgi:hypothetical protein
MTEPEEQPSAHLPVPVTAAELHLLEEIAYEQGTTADQLARDHLVAWLAQERESRAQSSSGCAVWLAAPLVGLSLLASEVTGLTDLI